MIDLTDAHARIRAADAELVEYIVPPGRLAIEPGSLIAADQRLSLTAKGLDRLCQRIKAPASYVTTTPPDLQAGLIHHHLDQGPFRSRRPSTAGAGVGNRSA
jgi:hypothetical protein